jgi:hypothetical protein
VRDRKPFGVIAGLRAWVLLEVDTFHIVGRRHVQRESRRRETSLFRELLECHLLLLTITSDVDTVALT